MIDSMAWHLNWSHVTLKPAKNILSKTDLATNPHFSVAVPSLSAITEDALELPLCPVRALRIYLDRIWNIREGNEATLGLYEERLC